MADNVERLVKDKVPLDLFCKLQLILLYCDDYYIVTNEFVWLFFSLTWISLSLKENKGFQGSKIYF